MGKQPQSKDNEEAGNLPAEVGAALPTMVDSVEKFRDMLDMRKIQEAIEGVMAGNATYDRLKRSAIMAAVKDATLLKCSTVSVVMALMTAAELGLADVSGTTGFAYLIPRWNGDKGEYEATFMPGYRGLVMLARKSPGVRNVYAHVVYRGDDLEISLGTNKNVAHKPSLDPQRMASETTIRGVYSVIDYNDGDRDIEWMSLADILAIRERSASWKKRKKGPWATDLAEMGRKSCLKRSCKHGPQNPQLETALAAEHDYDEEDVEPDDPLAPGKGSIRNSPAATAAKALKDKEDKEAAAGAEAPPEGEEQHPWDGKAGDPPPAEGAIEEDGEGEGKGKPV